MRGHFSDSTLALKPRISLPRVSLPRGCRCVPPKRSSRWPIARQANPLIVNLVRPASALGTRSSRPWPADCLSGLMPRSRGVWGGGKVASPSTLVIQMAWLESLLSLKVDRPGQSNDDLDPFTGSAGSGRTRAQGQTMHVLADRLDSGRADTRRPRVREGSVDLTRVAGVGRVRPARSSRRHHHRSRVLLSPGDGAARVPIPYFSSGIGCDSLGGDVGRGGGAVRDLHMAPRRGPGGPPSAGDQSNRGLRAHVRGPAG